MTTSICNRAFLLAGCAGLAMFATPASAQDNASDGEAAETGENTGILVTARRREERLIDVPLSVSAISGESLEQQGVQDLTQVAQQVPALRVVDLGADRHVEEAVLAPGPVLVPRSAGPPVLGAVARLARQGQERGHAVAGAQDDATAIPTVAPVGSPLRDLGLPPKRNEARATFAGEDLELAFVSKHDRPPLPGSGRQPATTGSM